MRPDNNPSTVAVRNITSIHAWRIMYAPIKSRNSELLPERFSNARASLSAGLPGWEYESEGPCSFSYGGIGDRRNPHLSSSRVLQLSLTVCISSPPIKPHQINRPQTRLPARFPLKSHPILPIVKSSSPTHLTYPEQRSSPPRACQVSVRVRGPPITFPQYHWHAQSTLLAHPRSTQPFPFSA